MGIRSGSYNLFLLLHLIGVIGGFGPTLVAPFFGAQAKARPGREGLAISEATFEVIRKYAEWMIYSVPITGIVMVLLSDDGWQFSDAWISLSFLLYIAALGIVHAVQYPNLRRMNALMADLAAGAPAPGAAAGPGAPGGPPPQVAELEMRGQRVAAVGGVLNLILLLILILMVWKPGT
jgi:uncharacterized membrane protein